MKSSAWYHKLWRKKLEELPLKGDATAGWKLMQQQLDAHLPVSGAVTGGGVVKPLVSKLIALAGYVLPAAAMVGVATYVAVNTGTKHKQVNKKSKKTEYYIKRESDGRSKVQSNTIREDSLVTKIIKSASIASSTALQNSAYSTNYHQPKESSIQVDMKDAVSRLNSRATKTNISSNNLNINTTNFGSNGKVVKRGFFGAMKHSVTNHQNSNGHRGIDDVSEQANYMRRTTVTQNFDALALGARLTGKQLVAYRGQTWPPHAKLMPAQNDAYKYDLPKNKYINDEVTFPAEQFLDHAKAIKQKGVRVKADKATRNHTITELISPACNYGLQAGLTTGNGGTGFYLGITGNYALTKHWLAEAALLYNSSRMISGSFSHPSYYRPDSSATLSLADSRKVQSMDALLNIQYRINGLISLKAGPVLNFAGKQLNINTRLGPVGGFRDTLRRSGTIDSVRSTTVLTNKVNWGLTSGLSITLKHFNIEARYLWLPQYKVSNSWGTYNQPANKLQIGISYLFKSK